VSLGPRAGLYSTESHDWIATSAKPSTREQTSTYYNCALGALASSTKYTKALVDATAGKDSSVSSQQVNQNTDQINSSSVINYLPAISCSAPCNA
jgi:hypothetical protein